MLVVTLKYVLLILRADNRGEGGIMALTALAAQAAGGTPRRRTLPAAAGPVRRRAVLRRQRDHAGDVGAERGRGPGGRRRPALKRLRRCRIAIGVLVGAVPRCSATAPARVGKLFGPDHRAVVRAAGARPALLQIVAGAGDPAGAQSALAPSTSWSTAAGTCSPRVGAIVLALTGAEALYADMGHFGKQADPARLAGLVLPALALNYMGQGALLIRDPKAHRQPVLPPVPAGLADPGGGRWPRWPP